MKIPFSYRQHIFGTVLFASLAGHVICLSAGSFFSSKPEYGVEHGPSSMEVILLKTSAPRKENPKMLKNSFSKISPNPKKKS